MTEPYTKLHLYPDSDLRREGLPSQTPEESLNQDKDTSARLLDGIAEVIETMADSQTTFLKATGRKSTAAEAFNQTAVFAIYGGWGTGKTTFMWDLFAKLNKRGKGKVYPVWFNLWEHDKDVQPLVAMLNLAASDPRMPWRIRENKRFITLLKMAAMGIYDMTTHAASAVTSGAFVPPIASQIKGYHDMVKQETWLAMEDQTKRKQAFEKVVETLRNKAGKPLLFFIDDLDRCTPRTAVELLEKIRLNLTLPGCIFVIGADDTTIRRTIGDAYITDSDREYAKIAAHDAQSTDDEQAIWKRKEKIGKGYLEKMVQHAFYLPVLGQEESRSFLEDILKDNNLPPDENAITVLSIGFTNVDASRREIIRVGNAYTLNYYLSQPKIDDYQPSITALITVLQVLHPEVYEELRRNENRGRILNQFFSPVTPNTDKWIDDVPGLLDMIKVVGDVSEAKAKDLDRYLELSSSAAPSSSETADSGLRQNRWTQGSGSRLFPTDLEVRYEIRRGGFPLIRAQEYLREKGADAVGEVVWIGQYLWRVLHHFEELKFLLITDHVIGLHCVDNVNGDDHWKQWTETAVAKGMTPEDNKALTKRLRLIKVTEAKNYFSSQSDRIGYSTDDKEHIVRLWWWTQPESKTVYMQNVRSNAVHKDGGIIEVPDYWASDDGGIRPVLELDLSEIPT